MEVEDNCEKQCNNSSGVDVDSGVENMEVEDLDRKELLPRSRVSIYLNIGLSPNVGNSLNLC